MKGTKKSNISIVYLLLITCISIVLVLAFIIVKIIGIVDPRFLDAVRDNMQYIFLIISISFGIGILVYFALIRRLIKPLDALVEITEGFEKGDFSQRAIIVRDDEIGKLTHLFNSLADKIYGLVNDLEEKVKLRTLELEKANEDMLDSRNKLRLILDSTGEGIYGMDIEGKCTFCNTSSLKILGYNDYKELIGKNMHAQIHHTKRNGEIMPIEECRILKAILKGTHFHADDEVFWRKDGTYFDVDYNVYPQMKDGQVVGAVITFKDITESKLIQEQIDYLSFHDPVTGVYNRGFFESELIRRDESKYLPISIIYGDVNGLKLLNDMLGHEKGDELLYKTAQVLKRISREDDIVSRFGGDEFVILLTNTESKDADRIIQRIKSELANEKIAGIKGSISLASSTKISPEEDINTVLKNAETKMYKAKTLESKNINSGMLKDIMESLYENCPREKSHAINVSQMSEKIAINMKLPETEIKRVKDAGLYHDIGKVVLDKDILNKKDKLDDVEREEMERHPLTGYRLLNLFIETLDIAEIVLTHHERWDGLGYPKGLKSVEIPLLARIISVAEVYDAMTNKVGGKGFTHEEALEEIRSQSGIKYDPKVAESFLEI